MKIENIKEAQEIIESLKTSDKIRSKNRALINALFNGNPPYSEEEERENNILTNVNFLEASKIAHDARRSFENAILSPKKFFDITLIDGDPVKKQKWSIEITNRINKIMKNSYKYYMNLRGAIAQVVLHGYAPFIWDDIDDWMPTNIALDDCYFPSGAKVDLSNLTYFAIYTAYTPAQLSEMAFKDISEMSGWNKKLVSKILKKTIDRKISHVYDTDNLTDEKVEEIFKTQSLYYNSESVNLIGLWRFYYLDDNGEWRLKIFYAGTDNELTDEFLYESPYSLGKLDNFFNLIIADGSNVAPFKIHAIRGLGFLLYAICNIQNRLRCKFLDAVFESLLWYFKVSSPEERDKLLKLDLYHLGIIPEGVNFVTANERYKIDPNLVTLAMQQNRQNMAELSAAFLQNIYDGTNKEMTATEVIARQNTSQTLVSAMLNSIYQQIKFQYREICRRFLRKYSLNEDVQKFWRQISSLDIPEELLEVENFEIEPVKSIGYGNKLLQMAQIDKLMAMRPAFNPDAQIELLRMFTEINTDDPALAERLVPYQELGIKDAAFEGQIALGSLLQCLPVGIKMGINHIDYVASILSGLNNLINLYEQSGELPQEKEILGMANALSHVQQHLSIIAQDPINGEIVKAFSDMIAQIGNYIKAYSQRRLEQQESNLGMTPEEIAKIKKEEILAQSQAKIKEALAMQKMRHKDAAFLAELERRNKLAEAEAEIEKQKAYIKNAIKDAEKAKELLDVYEQNNKPVKPE